MKKTSILIISDATIFGGAENGLYLLIKFLDRKKFDITLACTDSYRINVLLEKIKDSNLKIVRFPAAKHREFDIKTSYKLAKIIYQSNPDIIYVNFIHHYYCKPVMFAIFPFLRKFKVVAAEQLIPDEDESQIIFFKRFLNHLWIHIIDKFIKTYIVVSDQNKETFIKNFNIMDKKINVIKNSIEIKEFSKDNVFRNEMHFSKKDKIMVTVARLNIQKGHIYLIKAIKQLVKKYKDVKFIFVGDGEIESYLREKVAEYSLDRSIFFLGFRSDIDSILNSSDVFILPSLFEGLPFSLLEAMNHSLPIVSTNVDGNAEVITNNYNGYLVNIKSVSALYNAISKLIDNYDIDGLKLGQNGFDRLKKDFNIRENIRKFEELFIAL